MKRQVLSAALALCLCLSAVPEAYARTDTRLPQANFRAAEYTAEPAPHETAGNLTEQQAYASMIALKEKDAYKEGTLWTNDTPYNNSNLYKWNGGPINGQNIAAVGCAAFAFILSDAAFGSLSATMKQGNIQLSDVHVGDILRLNGGAHTVIVLQKNEFGVVIAEGNYNKTVHWGRTLTKAEVEAAAALITRYPGGKPLEDGSSPDDPWEDGAEGTLVGGTSWKLSKSGTLTISGTGAMPDYQYDAATKTGNQPWSAYLDRILNIVIDDGVTSIGNNAFSGSKTMSVTIPEGVTRIGDNAFQACSELKSVNIPASITEMGSGVFMSSGLLYASFAPGGKQISLNSTFTQCWDLTSVTLPENITSIGDSLFQSCLSLSSVYIPKTVTEIQSSAFMNCKGLVIYFGGSEEDWKQVGPNSILLNQILQNQGITVIYNSEAPSPFEPGDNFIDDGTDPNPDHTHTWDSGSVTQEPDCTTDGIRTYTCTDPECGETKTETIPALGHDYGAWQTVTQPTTTSTGLQKRTCTRCGNEEEKTIPAITPPHSHPLLRFACCDEARYLHGTR